MEEHDTINKEGQMTNDKSKRCNGQHLNKSREKKKGRANDKKRQQITHKENQK